MKFEKRPDIIDATQWFRNGDCDDPGYGMTEVDRSKEGVIVRYCREPRMVPFVECQDCGATMASHGEVYQTAYFHEGEVIKTDPGDTKVCPGDWIVKNWRGFRFKLSDRQIKQYYKPLLYDDIIPEQGQV